MPEALDTWLKDALPLVPGAVPSVAARQLALAAREFFERSWAWRDRVEDLDAQAGATTHVLSPFDAVADVIGVLTVAFQGCPLAPLPSRPHRSSTSNLPYAYSTTVAPDVIRLYPELEVLVEDALTIEVALTPIVGATTLPDIARTKFYDAILDGFLARMLMHPNKPYSSAPLAGLHRKRFLAQMARFRGEARRGFLQSQNWAYPRGWGVSR